MWKLWREMSSIMCKCYVRFLLYLSFVLTSTHFSFYSKISFSVFLLDNVWYFTSSLHERMCIPCWNKIRKVRIPTHCKSKSLWTWAHWKNYHTIQITDTWHVPNNMFWVVHHDGWLSPCMYWKLVWLNPSPCQKLITFH